MTCDFASDVTEEREESWRKSVIEMFRILVIWTNVFQLWRPLENNLAWTKQRKSQINNMMYLEKGRTFWRLSM